MKNVVAGTAGHIDHGKTSLVRALTGIDTDRLEEEKRRGISIDLGFAHVTLNDSYRIAFVDVPGHEKFIKNMLAGVGGIDFVVLVVAADESVKPQTREHFDICRMLQIPRGLVAVTKIDLVDREIADLVRLEVEEFVAGSFLAGSPVVGVSAVTGEGLDDLRDALSRMAAEVPDRNSTQNFRMPVDRSFVMHGFGTVATGTILSGSVMAESELELHPSGDKVRVRGIQVHGEAARSASAGQRAALNLAGIEAANVPRGSVLARPGSFYPTVAFDAVLDLLPHAKALKNRAPVHFHSGAAEVTAEVRTLDRSALIEPGTAVPVRIILKQPLLLAPGDRFIVRRFSPVVTIGGGEIADAFPPPRLRPSEAVKRTIRLKGSSLPERVAILVKESQMGLSSGALAAKTAAAEKAVEAAMPASVVRVSDTPVWYADREWIAETASRWRTMLAAYHRQNPLLSGIRREEFRSRELPGGPAALFEAIIQQEPVIRSTGGILHLASHKLALKADEEQALSTIEAAFRQAQLSVPGTAAVLAQSGVDSVRARSLLEVLLRQKRLTRISEDLIFHPAALSDLRDSIRGAGVARFTVADFKEWTGISRKYAIPLLEYLDRERVTRRDGEYRIIVPSSSNPA